MQVTEKNAEGLKRELAVVLAKDDLSARVDKRIDEIKDNVQIKGFRKGKVPPAHLRKVYGKSLMAEVLQQAVEETTKQALTDRDERPAMQPKIELPEDQDEIDRIIDGKADLEFKMEYEVLPKFELVDASTIEIEKQVADVADSAIDEAIADIAKQNMSYEADAERVAEDGDQLSIDFVGRIDGEEFEGGTAEDIKIVLGAGGFIPGFEDGLTGAKAGEERKVTVTFPEDYPVDTLKGREAVFDVTVREVAVPKEVTIDDAFAESLGVENVEKLREAVSAQIASEYEKYTRARLKRALLDKLDEAHDFELPPSLVETEFDGMWEQLTKQLEQTGRSFEEEGKTEDGARAEYRKLAERRVRLGLVIGEIGERGNIDVTQDELRRALFEEARRYPGQEKFVYEYYEKTPGAIAQLRAPLFEDKVVDHVLSQAQVSETKVPADELMKPLDDDNALTEPQASADEQATG